MEMVICQETPSHGKKNGNLTAARHAPSKKVRYTRYYRFLRCAFLSVKQNYGKIRPRRAAVVCLPMSNLFSISIILSMTITNSLIIIFFLLKAPCLVYPDTPMKSCRNRSWSSCALLAVYHRNEPELYALSSWKSPQSHAIHIIYPY